MGGHVIFKRNDNLVHTECHISQTFKLKRSQSKNAVT